MATTGNGYRNGEMLTGGEETDESDDGSGNISMTSN